MLMRLEQTEGEERVGEKMGEHTVSLLRYLHATAIRSRRANDDMSSTDWMSLHRKPKHADKYLYESIS